MNIAKTTKVIYGRRLALEPVFSITNQYSLMVVVSDSMIATSDFA